MTTHKPIIRSHEDYTSSFYSFGFKILWAARGTLDSTWKTDHDFSPHTRLYFVNSGRGWLSHNGKTLPLEGGYVYVIPSNCAISHDCEYLDKIWIHLNIHGIDKLDLMMKYTEVKRFKFSPREFDELYAALTAGDYTRLIKVFSIIQNVILTYTSSTPMALPIKTYSVLITKALKYIQKNIRISLRTEDVASYLSVATPTLRQKFKEEVGEPIGKYIDRLVFDEAQKLLMDDWISIVEISRRLDFNDRFYFSKRFKELFDMTPVQYRKSVLNHTESKQ